MPRARLYVDGFNVYYGALKNRGAGYRWFDPQALATRKLPHLEIVEMVYSTAHIKGDQDKAAKQGKYLAALANHRLATVILGTYRQREKRGEQILPAVPKHLQPKIVTVKVWEEKGSDVNLATRLIVDAFAADDQQNSFEEAIVMSNDSDLVAPIRHIRHVLHKRVTVLYNFERVGEDNRRTRAYLGEMDAAASAYMSYLDSDVAACQMPDPVKTITTNKDIAKPQGW